MKDYHDSSILTDPVFSTACPKCGDMLDVSSVPSFSVVQCPSCQFEFSVPARFGSFMLLELLGSGGMGGVYRARDEALNREVAIKVMLKSLGDDPQFVESFQREAQAAARLNHQNIAQIYSFGQEKGQPYIAMELVSGGSLDKMMTTQSPLNPAAVIQIGMQVAEGLSLAAEAGMVHGDIKPENILFDSDKNAKLVDFGLSAMQSGPDNEIWGTPYYIAPEKVRRQKADHRSDIYSLGGTLYHAIAGVPPFEGTDATAVVKARFDGPPKHLNELRKDIPPEVDALVMRMLSLEPQTRYPTYGSLIGDMKRFLAKAGPVKLDKRGKKITIKGKAGLLSASGKVSTTGVIDELPPGMTPISEIEEEEEAEVGQRRGCKMMALAGLGCVLLLGLIVGGYFGIKAMDKGKRAAAERAQIIENQAKARTSIAKSVENAKALAERVRSFVPEAMGYANAAADEVVKALGEETRVAMTPPEPEPERGVQEVAAPNASTPDMPKLEEVAKLLPPEMAVMLGELGKLPTEQALAKIDAALKVVPADKLEEIKPHVETLKKVLTLKDAKPDAHAVQAEADATADSEPAGGAPAVVSTVRAMYLDAYAVKAAAVLADRRLETVEQQAHQAENFANITVQAAEDLIKLNNDLVAKVKSFGDEPLINEAPRRVSQLKRTLEAVKSDVVSLTTQKRFEAIEAEKRAQAEAEAEKKRQQQEAHVKKIADELERVKEVEASTTDTLKQFQFRDVTRAIKGVRDELETAEGQEAASIATDRALRIKDFLDFLVKRVPGFKSARGWAVDGADATFLSVGGRKIKWTEVFENRMEIVAELVMGLVANEQAVKDLRLREKTQLMTNAALCLNLFYKENQSAQDLAKKLANDAATQFDVDADTIKQLLPEYFLRCAISVRVAVMMC